MSFAGGNTEERSNSVTKVGPECIFFIVRIGTCWHSAWEMNLFSVAVNRIDTYVVV